MLLGIFQYFMWGLKKEKAGKDEKVEKTPSSQINSKDNLVNSHLLTKYIALHSAHYIFFIKQIVIATTPSRYPDGSHNMSLTEVTKF